jgi:hypothetical protein
MKLKLLQQFSCHLNLFIYKDFNSFKLSRAEQQGIESPYFQPGKPKQNAFIERFNRSVRQEVLNSWLFDSLA